jgi:hypothetical protein
MQRRKFLAIGSVVAVTELALGSGLQGQGAGEVKSAPV